MPDPGARRRRNAGLALCLLCAFAWLSAERAFALDPDKLFAHYVANNWSIQDGLPQITVMAIAQDRDGYIWVGTQDGLARFDGVRFTSYTPDDTPQLPGIWIRALMLDRGGRLWIGSYKGLAFYENGRFTTVPPADLSAHPTLDVYGLAQGPDDAILVATSDGLLRVDGGKLVATGATIKPAYSVLPRKDGIWIGGIGDVERFDAGKSERMPLPATDSAAAVNRLLDARGRIWAGTSQGLFVREDGAWKTLGGDPKLTSSPVNMLFEDQDRNLWAGANAALMRLRQGGQLESMTGRPPISYKDIRSAFEDREGNLWLGSQFEGLVRLWNGWTRRYSVDVGLNDPVVWSLARGTDGTLWIGGNDGVSVLDHGRIVSVVPGSALPHPQAYNLLSEPGRLWIGTRRGLAILRDGRAETAPIFAPMASAQIDGIVRDADGSLWFPTSNGLFRLEHPDQPNQRLRRYGQDEGLTNPFVRVMLRLHDGRLLLGSQGGIYEMRSERFQPFAPNAGMPANTDVVSMHELPSGAIVAGNPSEQLYVFENGRWNRIGPEQGLPSNEVFFMAEDGGYLWLAGIRGIARVPIEDIERFDRGEIRQVRGEMLLNERGDRNAGQQGFCCNGAGMAKGFLDGHVLWLPSRDGVVALDTRGIVKNKVAPNVLVERVNYPGGGYDARTMPDELPSNARDLAFEFTAPSFQDPRSIQIRYRLTGYDRDWHLLDDPGRRRANYTNLPAGDYVFEVMAANNAGVWNPRAARLAFRIHPYFHETRLFDLLMLALLGVLAYAGYRWQHQRHEAQRVQLEQQVLERTQQLHIANERLENASQTDPLTGLRNRRYLANQIPADLAWYDRDPQRHARSGQVILFALVNVDGRSATNQTRERGGDRVLQQFAQMLSARLRSSDYIARWNADEFLIVTRPLPDAQANTIGERIFAEISRHTFYMDDGRTAALSASIGIALYPLQHDTERRPGWEQMVELAGTAMHWLRQRGREGWAIFRPGPRADLHVLLRDLHHDPQALLDSGRAICESSSSDDAPQPRG
jgi:diguanylate cyclase (GGDEF)-like protein